MVIAKTKTGWPWSSYYRRAEYPSNALICSTELKYVWVLK